MRFQPRLGIRSLMILVLLVALAAGSMIAVTKHLLMDRAGLARQRTLQKKLAGWQLYAWHRSQQQACEAALAAKAPYDLAQREAVYAADARQIPAVQHDQINALNVQGGWQTEASNHQYWADRLHDQFIDFQDATGR